MPLRVTEEYSVDEVVKKVHRKMSRSGHYQKVRRPTGLEVYNDAANILEELLEKRIDRDFKVARARRNRTVHSTQMESDISTGGEVTVSRCKTMPSRYRESVISEINEKELEEEGVIEKKKRTKTNSFIAVESDSSANVTEAESDAEDTDVTQNRKKKSLFKRAKENLIRSFRRDQKEGFRKPASESKESPSTKKKKTKKKSDSIVRESKRSVKGRLNKDKSIDYVEIIDSRHSKPSSNTEIISRKSRSGSMSRGSLIDAIKKPFRKSKTVRNEDDEGSRISTASVDPSSEVRNLSITDDYLLHGHSGVSPSSSRPFPGTNASKEPPISPSSPSNKVPSSLDLMIGKGGTLSSNASTAYPTSSDINNSVGSLNQLPSVKSNVLDSPGDNFEFIDLDEKEKRKSLIKYHGSEGLLNLQWLAEQTANAKTFNFEIDEHSVSMQRPDGNVETVTTVTATRTVVLPGVHAEGEDANDGNTPEEDEIPNEDVIPNKDEIYGKIAQKLIEMADTYGSNMSDSENIGNASVGIEDAPLTDLEKEIIACLRSGGDRYGKKMEDQLDAFKTAVAEDAYGRFRSTVENSMGHELSWNTLALLFYATKGVVSAVGKSSKVAVQAKEFTLKYISDTFVSWIMEQGGFDSMLSGSESDPELD